MNYKNTNCSLFLNLSRLLMLVLILVSVDLDVSSSCDTECGGISIPFPFGIGERCALDKYYVIECRPITTTSRNQVPFLSLIGKEVVSITPPTADTGGEAYRRYSSLRVKIPITSSGCSKDGKDSKPMVDLTGSPFFVGDMNSLVAVGCSTKASLTHIGLNMVGCASNCSSASEDSNSNTIPFSDISECSSVNNCTVISPEETRCDGNRCCEVSLPDLQQTIGIRIESNDENSTAREHCRVAFLTDEFYTFSNATKPEQLFFKGFTTVQLVWFIHTKNSSFLNYLGCKNKKDHNRNTNLFAAHNIKCLCQKSNIPEFSYATCGCIKGYKGNPYTLDGCIDVDECKLKEDSCKESQTCVNTLGGYYCRGDKTKPVLIGVGAGFGVLVLVGVVWWSRKFIIKRRITKRKKKFFKRNGGLLLQQELNTRENNVERMRIFSSKELEKATGNFSENRVLGRGGQGTVYKGMLVDGRTVAVKKSKVIDEDKLQEFINEVVILSQINHRHVVKLLGCCLETEVPILVYEFVLNGNLFQHIHEESDDYAMVWGVRLRIAVDISGALSYLHSYAYSPVYHRDIKSTNILLDEKFRAKVSDFGTSRSVTIDQTHWTTLISGTVGYVDPEYYKSSQYTEKSDVYSFGVVLAELITGDKPVIMVQDTREIISLVEHFKDAMKEKRFFEIVDARIRDDCKPEQVMAVGNLAMKCLKSKGKNRPNMREVYTELEKIYTSQEDVLAQVDKEEDEDDEEEEEFKNIMKKSESWSIGVTAPAHSIVVSSSCSDNEPLFQAQ